jgi:hypothetical protein
MTLRWSTPKVNQRFTPPTNIQAHTKKARREPRKTNTHAFTRLWGGVAPCARWGQCRFPRHPGSRSEILSRAPADRACHRDSNAHVHSEGKLSPSSRKSQYVNSRA